MSGFIIAALNMVLHGEMPPTASCPVKESSSAVIMFVVVLSEKMKICPVQCWGGQLGANRGHACAISPSF